MNFHDKKEIPPKYIYLFLAIICFVLLFLSVVFESKFTAFKKITSTVIIPMQQGINRVGTSIYDNVTNHRTKVELIADNKELSAKLDEYSAQIKNYEQKTYELERLQELLDLKEQYAQYHVTGARVIATDSTNWFSTFIIDKGSKDDIQVGCNVLANGGLAGIVTEVGEDYAKVRAIVDDNSSISANISDCDMLCTVSGDLKSMKNGYINVDYISKDNDIADHAELVTSHVSDKFLPGILIGYITEVVLDSNNLTKSAKCIPVVDFTNLQEVLVILDLKVNYKSQSENKNIFDAISKKDTTENASTQSDETHTDDDSQEDMSSDTLEDASQEANDTTDRLEDSDDVSQGQDEGGQENLDEE